MTCSFCQYSQNGTNDSICQRCGTILSCLIDLGPGVLHYGVFAVVPRHGLWEMRVPIGTSRKEAIAYFNIAARRVPLLDQSVIGELCVMGQPNHWSVRSWNLLEQLPNGMWIETTHRPLPSPHNIQVADASIITVPV